MKKYLIAFLIGMLASGFPCVSWAATGLGDGVVLDEQSAAPSTPGSGKVHIYVDNTSTPVLKMKDDAATVTTISSSTAGNLDSAYDYGGAGTGKTIDAADGAVTISNDDADAASILAISHTGNAAGDGITITLANGSSDGIEFENTGTGYDIEGTGALWYATKLGALYGASLETVGDTTVGGNLTVTGTTTLSGALYQAAIAAAAAGNENLTINAAGNGTINVGGISTGAITLTRDTTALGTLVVNGNTDIGNAATDTLTITSIIDGDVTLDDGSTNSPSLILKDATDETATLLKVDGGNVTMTPGAATESFQVLTGNLKVGNGSEGVTLNGNDAYVTGTFEVDGAVTIDGTFGANGAATFAGTTAFTGATNIFTLGAAEYVQLDAGTAAHTDTAGALDINVIAGATSVSGILLDFEAENTFANGYGLYINVDDDATGGEETVDCIYLANSEGTASTVNGIQAANTLDVVVDAIMGAAGQFAVINAATTDSTATGGVIDIDFDSITTAAMALNLKTTLPASAGAGVEVTGLYLDVDDDSDSASTVTAITMDSTDATGSSEARGIAFETIAGGDTLLDTCIYAETDADTVVLVVEADGTAYTGVTGLIDIGMTSATTAAEAMNIMITTTDGTGSEYLTGVMLDVDDDSAAASFISGLTIDASDVTGSSEVRGISFESQAGADTALEKCIVAQLPAAGQALVIDAAGTDQTGVEGVVDIEFDSRTAAAAAINVKATHVAGGSGQKIAAIEAEIDADDDNVADETYGLLVNATDTTSTGITEGVHVEGAGLDVGVQVDHGGLRVGTGSSPDLTAGDDTVYVEGTIEADGNVRIDGNIDANGDIVGAGPTTYIEGMVPQVEDYTGADNVITIAESGKVFTNTGDGDGSQHTLPEASTAIGCTYTFVVTVAQAMVVELDNADVFLHLGVDAGDQLQSSTVGDVLKVIAVSASQWAVITSYPTAADWADGGA